MTWRSLFILFLVFEIGFLCVALTDLDLLRTGWPPNSQRSTNLCLSSAGIKGMCHCALAILLKNQKWVFSVALKSRYTPLKNTPF
ncbi:rCG38148, isoform CRA_a [Rattus norvegicus]|uniref:RCG38148, isoform CRA_a n=1 Tax=Rattus norvegicus TaxID=10116 RepID=A6IV23_RAT|nr:rCG38148, isoform CRA_a [Rattus norvegicus]EDM07158.1 rCG38148, isoform CRA_a [Rattus norvegicus]